MDGLTLGIAVFNLDYVMDITRILIIIAIYCVTFYALFRLPGLFKLPRIVREQDRRIDRLEKKIDELEKKIGEK